MRDSIYYQEKLVQKVVLRAGSKLFLPYPIRAAYAAFKSLHYIWKGLRCLAGRKLEVEVLDATAIGVSVLRADFDTASSIMFLLGIGGPTRNLWMTWHAACP